MEESHRRASLALPLDFLGDFLADVRPFVEMADRLIITDCPFVIQRTDLIFLGRFNHIRH
jgi:hypothetical protein